MNSKFLATVILLTCLALVSCSEQKAINPAEQVSIDFTMADQTLNWLELVKDGASDEEIHNYFMAHVAPTEGCQAIIHHWARFMTWDNDLFLKFVLEGLGKIESDSPLKNEDGTLTNLGRRRMLWGAALENIDQLKKDIAALEQMHLTERASALAAKFLPENTQLKANFYIVLFGGSSAFSVGEENGFDMLQMPRKADGSLDIDDALRTFAHELHHTGFAFLNDSLGSDETMLVGILAAEGAPTYFVDSFASRLDDYTKSSDPLQNDVARDWLKHQERLKELYAEAAVDIELNLNDAESRKELFGKWMGGIKGAAYVLGADMYATIDRNLGLDSAKAVMADHRKMLLIYNEAARKANESGANCFIFDDSLAARLAREEPS